MSGVHAILGHRGSGKSRLARAIVAGERRLLIVDTLGEHADIAYRTVTLDDLSDALERDPDAYRYAVRPNTLEALDWIERVAASRPGCCLMIDEIDWWYPDSRATLGPGLASMVRYGRHYGQSVVAVARRPADLSRSVTSQATLWAFPMREPRDRAYVGEFAELDPGELRVTREHDGLILETEIARAGVRGIERGVFSLEEGIFSFPIAAQTG